MTDQGQPYQRQVQPSFPERLFLAGISGRSAVHRGRSEKHDVTFLIWLEVLVLEQWYCSDYPYVGLLLLRALSRCDMLEH